MPCCEYSNSKLPVKVVVKVSSVVKHVVRVMVEADVMQQSRHVVITVVIMGFAQSCTRQKQNSEIVENLAE